MTDTPEPTDADVERLAELVHIPGLSNVADDREVAIRLLAAGVQLPPVPEPPEAEPERYTSAIHGSGQWVLWDHQDPHKHGNQQAQRSLTQRAVRLLNLDAKYEDGIEAEVERLQARGDAFQAKFEEQCQRGDDLFTGRYETIKRAVSAEARVKELEAELAEAHDHDAWLSHLVDEWGARGVASKLMEGMTDDQARRWLRVLQADVDAASADAASPTDAPDPVDACPHVTDGNNPLACPPSCHGSHNCLRQAFAPAPTPDDAKAPSDEAKKDDRGLHGKFIVMRSDGRDAPGDKHDGCEYFVLDLTHDEAARSVMPALAAAYEAKRPQLAADLGVRFPAAKKDDGNAERRICGLCGHPMRGMAQAGDVWLCHPDEGQDCYHLWTVYKRRPLVADATPASRPVTAEMVDRAWEGEDGGVTSSQELADALNVQIGTHPLPTADEMEDAMAQGLTPGDQVARVMALLAQPTQEGE